MLTTLVGRYNEMQRDGSTVEVAGPIITVNGHETGWVAFAYLDRKGERCVYYDAKCECDFTPGIGFSAEEGPKVTLHRQTPCLDFLAAIERRNLELRLEFFRHTGRPWSTLTALNLRAMLEFLFPLIRDNQWVQSYHSIYGGLLSVGTAAGILGVFMGDLWQPVVQLANDGVISFDGAMIIGGPEGIEPTLGRALADAIDADRDRIGE